MTDLQIYEKYCHNKPRSESLWRQCSDCAFFQVNTVSTIKFCLVLFLSFDTFVSLLQSGVSEKAGA